MSWIKGILSTFGYSVFLVISVAMLLEIIFRILPTSDSFETKAVNGDNKILRFQENRDVTKQIGFNFRHVNVKHSNNFGFFSDRDFMNKVSQKNPVIAVIGDSYVEAAQVSNKDAFHSILDFQLPNHDVYPLGMSGSPLSQYVAYARFVQNEFDPVAYVFLIVSNDFDESFYEIKKEPGYHYFHPDDGLELFEYSPSTLKRVARKSAFVRYVYLDLQLPAQLSRIFKGKDISNDSNAGDGKFLRRGQMAIERFFAEICKLTEESNVILLLDGDRKAIYSGMSQRNMSRPENILFETFVEKSESHCSEAHVVDLHEAFLSDWAENKEMFNFDYDWHWNEHGHAIVAHALQEKITSIDWQ